MFYFVLLGAFLSLSACNNHLPAENAEYYKESKKIKIIPEKANMLFQDQQNRYWFKCEEGIFCLTSSDFSQKKSDNIQVYTKKDGITDFNVLSVQADANSNLYFDTPSGVFVFDGKKFKVLPIVEGNNPWKLEPTDLWFRMGWDHNGPFRYDGEKLYALKFPNNPQEKQFRKEYPEAIYNPYGVYSIYKAKNGDMWFGTSSLGVYRYDGKVISWMYKKDLTDTPEGASFGIRSICEDKEGFFWICNNDQKFSFLPYQESESQWSPLRYTQQKGIELPDGNTDYFFTILNDRNGGLWFVTFKEGVYCKTGNSIKHFPVQADGKPISLFSLYEDNQGKLWLNTHEFGAYVFDGNEFVKWKR